MDKDRHTVMHDEGYTESRLGNGALIWYFSRKQYRRYELCSARICFLLISQASRLLQSTLELLECISSLITHHSHHCYPITVVSYNHTCSDSITSYVHLSISTSVSADTSNHTARRVKKIRAGSQVATKARYR